MGDWEDVAGTEVDAGGAPYGERATGPEGLGPEGLGPEGLGPEGLGPEGLGPEGLGPEGPEELVAEDAGLGDGARAQAASPGEESAGDLAGEGPEEGPEDLARQRDEYLESLRRLQADFENYRKRVERQQRDLLDSAATSLVKKLLPVLDTADLALAHGGGEDVKQVASALFDVLSKEGLERLVPEGQSFDPEQHDAVVHEPAEGDDAPDAPEVSDVFRAGYRWKGRVLRPAMVKVRG